MYLENLPEPLKLHAKITWPRGPSWRLLLFLLTCLTIWVSGRQAAAAASSTRKTAGSPYEHQLFSGNPVVLAPPAAPRRLWGTSAVWPARNFITQKSNLLLRICIFLSNPAPSPWDCLLRCALAACPRAVFCACIRGFGAIWASGAPKTRHFGHLSGAK